VNRPRDLERRRALLTTGDRGAWRELLAGIKAREPEAITLFVEWMRPRLVGRFRRKGVDEAEAECMAQDVLLAFVWRYADTVRHPQAIDAYLRLMSATALRRRRRELARRGHATESLELAAPVDGLPEPGSGIDRRRLADCLDGLTTRARGRLQKHFHLGLGFAEIGRSEGCTGQAARQSVVAALAALRRCMEVEA